MFVTAARSSTSEAVCASLPTLSRCTRASRRSALETGHGSKLAVDRRRRNQRHDWALRSLRGGLRRGARFRAATRILPAERPSRGAQRVSSGPALRTTQRCYPRYSPSHNWRRPSRAKSRYPRDTCSARYAAWRDAASREPSIRMEALASSSNADESRWTVVGSPRAGSVAMRPRLDCTSAKLLLSMQMPAEANDRPVGAKERDSEITLEAPRISTCELVVSGLETRAQRLASRATLGMACMIGSRSRPPARPW